VNGRDERHQPLVGKSTVLTTLHYKGTKAQLITRFTRRQYLLVGESITLYSTIVAPDTTVQAVVATIVAHLNKATYIYTPAEVALGHFGSMFFQYMKRTVIA
jgi:hypothetical protein